MQVSKSNEELERIDAAKDVTSSVQALMTDMMSELSSRLQKVENFEAYIAVLRGQADKLLLDISQGEFSEVVSPAVDQVSQLGFSKASNGNGNSSNSKGPSGKETKTGSVSAANRKKK